MRGKKPTKLFDALIYICAALVMCISLKASKVDAISGGTNLPALHISLAANPIPTNYDAPLTVSYVANIASVATYGTMNVYLYCDMPVYATLTGSGAPVFQYPGIPVDLRNGYAVKKSNIPVTSTVSFPNACTYTSKGITYLPVAVVEYSDNAAWITTDVKTNSAVAPYPSPSPSSSQTSGASSLTNYSARLLRTGSGTATVPYTDSLDASIMVPSQTSSSGWVLYISGGPFGYDLCCDKNSIGSCNAQVPTVWQGGSPYPFNNACTYTKAGTYTREVRATNFTNLNTASGYKYATNQITVVDPTTNLSVDLMNTPSQPTNDRDTTLTATAITNNVNNTINYSIWWQCKSSATNYANAKADCGDPSNSELGAKFDGVSPHRPSQSVAHRYGAGIYHPKVIIEQGNATATKDYDLTIHNAPTIVPLIQATDKNTIVNGTTRQYSLVASQSGYRIQANQNYYLWWNCDKGLDSVADTLTGCGATNPTHYNSWINSTSNSVSIDHNYLPGTYKPKVIVRRDSLEKAAYTTLTVPPIAASVSPSPSRTPSVVPSPSRTPSVVPSPSRTPSVIPSPSPSPSRTPGQMTLALDVSPDTIMQDETITMTANVTDTNTSLASTSYTFWWNCNNSSTSVETTVSDQSCGPVRNVDDSTTDAYAVNGITFQGKYSGTSLNRSLLNQKIATKKFAAGPRTIKVIVERRGQAIETRHAIYINPYTLDLDFVVSPANTAVNAPVSFEAVADSNDMTSGYNYYFWWDCNNITTSLTEATSKCGSPSEASKGAQFTDLDSSDTSKSVQTQYLTAGAKKPKLLVVHGNLSTSMLGDVLIQAPTLTAGLTVNPAQVEGEASPANLMAAAGGTAEGSVNYTFWWDCDNSTASLSEATSACGSPFDEEKGTKEEAVEENSLNVTHDYTEPGTYHPKVIVERDGAAAAEARSQIVVTEIPEKTLNVDLNAQRAGTSFPVNMILGATLSGTATGNATYRFWWDCQPSEYDVDSIVNACGDPDDSANGMVINTGQSSKNVSHYYTLAGLRHPLVLVERENALAFKTAEIEIPESPNPSATPTDSQTATPSETPTDTSEVSFPAGFSVLGFNFPITSSIFNDQGLKIYSLNQSARNWDIIGPEDEARDLEPNKAYYFYADQETTAQIASGQVSSEITLTPGWNFVWNDSQRNLNSFKVSVYNSGECIAKNVPLGVLKSASVIYRWIYVVEEGQSIIPCQAFSLLTGSDESSTGCSDSNPLLNEVSSAKANKGVWIYLFGSKLDGWSDKEQFGCN